MSDSPSGDVLIEAEEFDDCGAWVLDAQFANEMGSPYLLANGSGRPIADARIAVDIAEAGTYSVCVRTKDWFPRIIPAVASCRWVTSGWPPSSALTARIGAGSQPGAPS